MEIYSAERKKLENTTLLLLDRNVRDCSTMRANRGIPCDLDGEGKHLTKGQSAFRRKGDIMVQGWKDKTCANDKYNP
jgi:hypothetical protein